MSRKMEEVYVDFLMQVTGQKAKCQRDRTWRSVAAARILKEAGTQTLGKYINKLQTTVAEWVALRLILDIFDR